MLRIAAGHLKDEHLASEVQSRKVGWDVWIQFMTDDVVDVRRSRIPIAHIVHERATPGDHHRPGKGQEQRTQHPQPKGQEPASSSGRFRLWRDLPHEFWHLFGCGGTPRSRFGELRGARRLNR
ncbi:hypothetical protein [Ktedonobacter robiniae]|uniref:Uncharacterized protein n=1 Tax=Ktedonobacter robiniae TaxID=2778365 RepID=A0ABQ3UZI7_9CHLR|nr:hypothetical protein [Ktedonobacter robiniae]GHO58213.1 hypothetical protein KSB_66880 [Ktedonobacter robiniae]